MELEMFQFISRNNINNQKIGNAVHAPKQRPDICFKTEFEVIDRPFELNFAQPIHSKPSIGASEYLDPVVDLYMKQRWPKCIKGKATVDLNDSDRNNPAIIDSILLFFRNLCSEMLTNSKKDNMIRDQFSSKRAYRREFIGFQLFDIDRNRRPYNTNRFRLTNVGEFIGPGVATIVSNQPFGVNNELFWSQIIFISNVTDLVNDNKRINSKILELKKHYNAYNELNDARRLLSIGELKSSVRSAASSIDAILRYFCQFWDLKFPGGNIQFNDKIEIVLSDAKLPSFKSVDNYTSNILLYLYRARNSMHEGDCYYNDDCNNKIQVIRKEQVEEFIIAVEKFTLWFDSMI